MTTSAGLRSKPESTVSLPSVSGPLPVISRPISRERQRMADVKLEMERYARTFQPGVTMDDSLPQFAVMYMDIDGPSSFTRLYEFQQQIPVDDWSATMEYRLRSYFEIQPESSMTRISVNCRSARCLVQFTELRPTLENSRNSQPQNSNAMLLRLKKETWYSKNFDDDGRPLLGLPGTPVQYMVQVLNKVNSRKHAFQEKPTE
jgi:hypothetical protein